MKRIAFIVVILILFVMANYCTPSHYLERAEELSDQGEYEEAIEIYSSLIKRGHHLVDAYSSRGYNYAMIDESILSIEDYLKVIELDFNNPSAHLNLGIQYHLIDEYEKAIEHFNHAYYIESFTVKLIDRYYPYSVDIKRILYERGHCYATYAMKESNDEYASKAISDLERNVKLSGFSLDQSYNDLGLMYFNLGYQDKSCNYWKKGIEFDHDLALENYNRFCKKKDSLSQK